MSTRKTSVSLTEDAILAAQVAAERAGMSVSAWLSHAALEQAWREQALAAADQLHDDAVRASGPPTPDDQQWLVETLSATLGQDGPSESTAA